MFITLLYRFLTCFKRSCSTGEIRVPKRIPRSPTDILQALAGTVQKDTTAAHYKYHDDPFLIPTSNIGKRTFAMAQEAGRKAAHWIRQEHADLFQHKHAVPEVKMFIPRKVYGEESEVTEQDLAEQIRDVQVAGAISVFELLEKKGVVVSDSVLQSFLEFVCFYNGEDTLPEEFIEERWFRQGTKGRDRLRKTWKDAGIAESVFIRIDPPTSEAYCAIIQGMAKYCQVDRAWELYQETRAKGLAVSTDTYNALIQVASFLKEGYDLRWKLVQDLLMEMAREGHKPNIGTLNAVLGTLSTMPGFRQTKNLILQTLSEFKHAGIEPSLASYYFILITLCRERGRTHYILHDILNEIEGKHFKIQDFKDTFFFVTAMDVCRNHLNDKDLADRVDALLHTGNNYDLIGDSYKESIYYRHYIALLCRSEPLDVFLQKYDQLVPNIYIPEPGIMSEILETVNMNGTIEYIPKLWSDMVMFDHTDRENLLSAVLNIMVSNPVPDDLVEKFAEIGWDVWVKVEEQPEFRTKRLKYV